MSDSQAYRSSKLPVRRIVTICIFWALIVAAILVWQAYTYSGVYAWIAELQFRHIDGLFPVATIIAIVILASLPLLILITLRLRRRRKRDGPPSSRAILSRDSFIRRVLGGMAIFSVLCAIGLVFTGLSIGSLSDKPLTNLSFEKDANPGDNYIKTKALVLTNRIGYYNEAAGITGRTLYVAPILANNDSEKIKYFLEIPKQEAAPSKQREVTGFMKAQSVPGGLERLYENAGYVIDRPTYVIFTDHISARWPWFSTAGVMTILALFLVVGFILQTLHLRRLRRKAKGLVNPET